MDLVSIIIPCYNVDKYIKKCIDSVKKQKYKNIEVLLIDDESTDNTKDIIIKEIENDNRFIYIRKKNGGVSDARNYGLKRAKGKYICFIDSDDYVLEDYILELYKSIKGKKNTISVCYFDRVYDNKTTINYLENNIPFLIKHPAVWNKMYNFDELKSIDLKFYKNIWYEDLNFFLKLIINIDKIELVEKSLYKYIQNPSSIMHKSDNRIFQIFDCLEDVEKYAKKRNKFNDICDYIEFAYVYHVLVGTIFRASFFKKYVEDIIKKVVDKYPNCWKNKYIKSLPLSFKLYLKLLRRKCFRGIICFLLKRLNKHLNI